VNNLKRINKKLFFEKFSGYIFSIFFSIIIFILIMYALPQVRIGDGSEYYALFFAFKAKNLPWMTPEAYIQYDQLLQSGKIVGLVGVEQLKGFFPALRIGETSDFNHFWFYSFMAFLAYKFFSFFGILLSAHQSFIALHCILLSSLFSLAFYFFRWKGILGVLLITLGSPILWFVDKVHSEFFTYALTFSAIILTYARQYFAGSFFLALASTQNPHFALVAFIPFLYRLILERLRLYSLKELCLFAGIVFIVFAHPLYYLSRYGVITPQLLAGGASPGNYLSVFYIWLIDPDIGLFPNWIFGFLLFIYFIGNNNLYKYKNIINNKFYIVFCILYLFIGLYASSSTTNLNSGATTGIARYALWYLPLFFPITMFFIGKIFNHKLLLPIFIILFIYNIYLNNPFGREEYLKPSKISFFIQENFPNIYDPPWQIFYERYSYSSTNNIEYRAVFGPDCHKVLIMQGFNEKSIYYPQECYFDKSVVGEYLEGSSKKNGAPFFLRLTNVEAENFKAKFKAGEYKVGLNQSGNSLIKTGWSGLEPSGLWSEGKKAQLIIPCDGFDVGTLQPIIFSKVVLLLTPFGKNQNIKLMSGNIPQSVINMLEGENKISIPIVREFCSKGYTHVEIEISNPRSPKELGLSQDPRKLGVFLSGYTLNTDH
jgi:hypothetical protein